MNIAYLTNQYPKVSHAFIRREILALEQLGHNIHRVTIRASNDQFADPDDIVEKNKTTILIKTKPLAILIAILVAVTSSPKKFISTLFYALKLGRTSSRGIIFHLIYFIEACILKQHLHKKNLYHLHVHFGTNPTTVALLSYKLGGPSFSFTVHGPKEFDDPKGIHLGEKIKHAAFVAAITNFCRSQLFRWCEHKHWQKIHIIHCGLDNKFINATPNPLPDQPNLLTIGRLCEQKAPQLIIQALHQLKQQNIPFHQTFVGDGELRNELETLIQQHHLQDNITITGWLSADQIQHQIQNAKLLLLPSFAEGLPVVIMESLALKRPVISTYIAAIPELITPNKTGFLCSPGSVEQLVETIRQALNTDTNTLATFGNNGRKRILQNHDIMTEAKKLANLFPKTPNA